MIWCLPALLVLPGCSQPNPLPISTCEPDATANLASPALLLRVRDPAGPAANVSVEMASSQRLSSFQPQEPVEGRADARGCIRLPFNMGPDKYRVSTSYTECLFATAWVEWSGEGNMAIDVERSCKPATRACAPQAPLDQSILLLHVGEGQGVPVTIGYTPGNPPGSQDVQSAAHGEVLHGEVADPSDESRAFHTDAFGCVAMRFIGVGVDRLAVDFGSCTRVDWLAWGGHTHLEWEAGRPVGNGEGPEPCPE